MSPVRLCSTPRCPNHATNRGTCDDCRKRYERERSRVRRAEGVERNRFYARKHWRIVRLPQLFEHPLCEIDGPGCLKIANEVHHRVALEDGGKPYSPSNLLSLCKPCHSRLTMREGRERGTGVRGARL